MKSFFILNSSARDLNTHVHENAIAESKYNDLAQERNARKIENGVASMIATGVGL